MPRMGQSVDSRRKNIPRRWFFGLGVADAKLGELAEVARWHGVERRGQRQSIFCYQRGLTTNYCYRRDPVVERTIIKVKQVCPAHPHSRTPSRKRSPPSLSPSPHADRRSA